MRPSEIAFVVFYLLTFAATVAFIQGVQDGRRVPLATCAAAAPPLYWYSIKGTLP
jgi:hypothetical protein